MEVEESSSSLAARIGERGLGGYLGMGEDVNFVVGLGKEKRRDGEGSRVAIVVDLWGLLSSQPFICANATSNFLSWKIYFEF